MNLIRLGKVMMLLFWLAELANLFQVFDGPLSRGLHVATLVLMVTHAVEAAVFTRLYANQMAEPKLHKMNIMIFGIFHWLDLAQQGRLPKLSRRGRS